MNVIITTEDKKRLLFFRLKLILFAILVGDILALLSSFSSIKGVLVVFVISLLFLSALVAVLLYMIQRKEIYDSVPDSIEIKEYNVIYRIKGNTYELLNPISINKKLGSISLNDGSKKIQIPNKFVDIDTLMEHIKASSES